MGNLLSQYFANFYLSKFDHWLKEIKKIKYYYRYCDDIVILSNNKQYLRDIFEEIRKYLDINLKLKIKSNFQIFPTNIRGIDFVGYKHFHTYVKLRKSIKQRFKKMLKDNYNQKSINSYNGWLKHGNCINLKNKYLNHEQERSNQKVR